jgi:hypothetical protein
VTAVVVASDDATGTSKRVNHRTAPGAPALPPHAMVDAIRAQLVTLSMKNSK